MVQTVKRLLFSRGAIVVFGIAVLAALVILLGPAISVGKSTPLESVGSRLAVAAFLPMIYLVFSQIRQRSMQLVNAKASMALGQVGLGAGETAAAGSRDAGAREAQLLSARFKDALGVLKKRRFANASGRRWLYQLPWYVIIGPPGSGKTTAITNSGLSFPLADKFGRTALGGVGGTRNCDWWFTDDAVLIDTAGRYTTQDSDAAQDSAAWAGFLRLLKRYRRRQPLNGVIVAIGISELTSASEEVRLGHAARIRQRVNELYKELGVRLPVYVLFTKCDLIAGFVEYFDDLGREGREAVWGLTFPFSQPEPEGGQISRYGEEFEALVGRLDDRLLERVQKEGDIQRRAFIFGFPQQVASLKDLTGQFLREAFEPNTFEESILLRGVYFVSGTQIGTPLDRVMDAMSRTFGMARPPSPEFSGNKRSYFLSRLLREVVFAEAWLVESDTRAARRLRLLRLSALAGIAVVAIALSGLSVAAYLRNQALISRIDVASTAYTTQASRLTLDRVADSDLRPVVPLLNELRALDPVYADRRSLSGWFGVLGLDQRAKLGIETRASYRHALSSVLLPRLILRLEGQLNAHQDDPAFLYPALEVYLMLGRQGPLSADIVRQWLTLDWASAYPDPEDAPLREALADHLDALLSAPFLDIGLDGDLIDRTRAVLLKVPLAQRVLDTIVRSPEAESLPVWTVADNAGPAADSVLHLRSGDPLSTGIPGIYTRDGFLTVFAPMLPHVADAAVGQGWILDPSRSADAVDETSDRAASQQAQRDATGLYLQQFSLRWDHLINDVSVKPVTTLDQSLRTLSVLSAPTSPIRILVAAAAHETSLDPAPSPGGASGAGANTTLSKLFVPAGLADSSGGIAASFAADHFKALHQLVEVPPNSGPQAQLPIDAAVADLDSLYHSLTAQGSGDGGPLEQAGQSDGAVQRLEGGAASLPDPIKGWVLGVGQTSSNLSASSARDQLTSLWNGGPGRLCAQVTRARYPFVRYAAQDAPIGDFGRLFASGGAIDSFVTQNLSRVIDTSGPAWRMRPGGSTDIAVPPGALAQFQNAAAIRDGMFANGGTTPAIGFQLSVVTLDLAAASVAIDIDGQQLTYAHGAPASMRMHWPAPQATGIASVTFTPPAAGAPATVTANGPWALFRLLDLGAAHQMGSPDQVQARFTAGGHVVVLRLVADSVLNPLDGGMLARFRCPASL